MKDLLVIERHAHEACGWIKKGAMGLLAIGTNKNLQVRDIFQSHSGPHSSNRCYGLKIFILSYVEV